MSVLGDPEGQSKILMIFLRSLSYAFLLASVATFPDFSSSLGSVTVFFGTPVTKASCRAVVLKLCVSGHSAVEDQSGPAPFKAHPWPPVGFKDQG